MSAPVDLSERLASLTPAQRALFELALKKQEKAPPPPAPALTIPKRRQQSPCVLSVDQERVWFVQQLDPESPVFNVYNALRFSGRIQPAVLDRALNEVVRRQEILRAWFTVIDGTPMQVIEPALTVTLPCIDLRSLPDEARDAEAQRIATDVVTPAIPMDRPPLFRMVLMQLGDEDFVLPSCIHHIIIDWVSFYSFTTELTVVYEAFLEGRPSPLPELPVQYPDYAEWQRKRLSDPAVTDRLVAWWKERLADAPELLPLPTDRPRPAVQTPWGRRSPLTLSAAHSAGLRELSQREGATLFIVLLAVLQATLSRLTGEEKLVVGTPSGHRIQPELQEVLGFFLNQLVFYTDLTGNPSLLDVVRRVKETAVGAYAHEELPFPRLVEALRPGRDLSRTPFTQVVLLLLNPQQVAEQLGGDDPSAGLGVENYWVDAHRTQFDMTLSFWESRTSPVLAGWWEHNTDLFDVTTMDRMKEQFRTLAAAFVADPGRPLWNVPLLTEPQRQQLLVEWAGGGLPASGPLLPERIAEHAARTPEAQAMVFEDRVLTYGDLDRRSNRLAHALRRHGIGPESLVGLRIERSPEMLVAVLGVWKAGGAYVPLDPDLPEARLAYLIEDSGASLVLTGDRLAELEADAPDDPLASPAGLSNAAYAIYTSGTTGQPKGVVIEHGSMLAVLEAGRRFLGLTAADRVSALASFSFDASVYDVYMALLAGACVHLYALRPALDFERLVADLGRLTVLHAVPVLMRQLVELARSAGPFPNLREVQMGADRVPLDLAAEVAEVFPRANVRVLYGPTETTVVCAQGLLSEYGTEPRVGTPMGRPMESAVVRLLDRRGGPIPSNVAGEVWIGGPGVARGYLNRPELTAEKFPVLDGQRFYRSGDLARWRGDGLLEFLGRVDQQVKVRGFRIEPGEIEAALTAWPEVREAVVTVHDGRLVAYFVPGETEISTEALRDHLRERLPEYMVPAAWVVLPSLPLTSSGKVDRKALPEPEAPAVGETVAPRTPGEERLAAIWSEVLGVPNVGVHDNFFTLGGDSILSIQVITRAQRDGIALTPRMLFQYQTVAELAAAAGSVGGVKAEQGPVTGPVSFTPIQRWFFDHKPPEPWHDNQALLLESRRRLDPAQLDAALARTALHHDALRLRFRRGVIGWEQWGSVPEGTSPLLTVDLSVLPEAACPPQIEAAAAAAQRSLDLSQGPLHRPVVFDLGDDRRGRPGRFLWVIHHLAVDGVSWRLLLEDLAAAYDGLPLPAKTTSYKEWSEHLADFSESEVLRRETDWWLERPWSEVVPLPADGPAPAFRETLADERSVSLSLDPDETRALLQEVPRVYNSQINDALLSALARACHAWTGSPVLLLDLEGHGREEIFPDVDLSRTVGWFTSVFPVLLDLRGAAGPGEALKAVKEHLRRIPNGGLGWGLLQASPESGRIARLPRPEVGFNYLGQVDQGLPKDLPFGAAAESAGPNRSPWAPRPHRLEWNGSVSGGRLHFVCTYGEGTFRRATVERLVAGLGTALRELIEHCRTPEAGGYTPSDFPLAGLSQGQLDKILARRKKPQ